MYRIEKVDVDNRRELTQALAFLRSCETYKDISEQDLMKTKDDIIRLVWEIEDGNDVCAMKYDVLCGIIGIERTYPYECGLNDLPYHPQTNNWIYKVSFLHIVPTDKELEVNKREFSILVREALAGKNDSFCALQDSCVSEMISMYIDALKDNGFEWYDEYKMYLRKPETIV